MKILICGGNGFIGRHLRARLINEGHRVISGVRQVVDQDNEIEIDFSKDTSVTVWKNRLSALEKSGKIDIVINSAGILMENQNARFSNVHEASPIALFRAAQEAGVRGIVHISALGSDCENSDRFVATPYLQSKRNADNALLGATCPALILRPSLVIGIDGTSSRLFRTLASFPIIALPGRGEQQLQPVHIDDVTCAVSNWIAQLSKSEDRYLPKEERVQIISAVGPCAMSYRDMLLHYRSLMGLGKPQHISIPMPVMRMLAHATQYLPQAMLSPDTLHMLEQNNIAEVTQFASLVGKPLIQADHWFNGAPSTGLAAEALKSWSTLVLQWSLAIVWFASGLLSLGIFPISESMALLAKLGLTGTLAKIVLFGSAGLDILLGCSCLFLVRKMTWLIQLLLVLFYSVLVAIFLPEFYLHPFGPLMKNLPIVAILLILYAGANK